MITKLLIEREESTVPRFLVRLYGLTDNPSTGEYKIIAKPAATFAKPISRTDVAKFLVKAVKDRTWDSTAGIIPSGGKKK